MSNSSKALWLVYDGDCPFCTAGARMYRLRQSVGELDALHLLATLGSDAGWLNRLNVSLFRRKTMINLLYPMMVGMRNLMLRLRGKKSI